MTGGTADHAQYVSAIASLDEYGRAMTSLIRALLGAGDVVPHTVSHRVKTMESADGKLARKSDRYSEYADLKDLLGLRIITYFSSDVDRVCDIVEREFDVDPSNSDDKREANAPEVFGYASAHYVVSLSRNRRRLPEHAAWRDTPFEVQIRTVLQHAWAEIEHDLGYKSASALPRSFRRRFSRLAGTLELVDAEFESLRQGLSSYEKTVAQRVVSSPADVGLNQASLETWFATSNAVEELRADFPDVTGVALTNAVRMLDSYAESFGALGVHSIAQLEQITASLKPYTLEFARLWLNDRRIRRGRQRGAAFPASVVVFYTLYALAASQGAETVARYLESASIGHGLMVSELESDIIEYWALTIKNVGALPGSVSN